MVPNLPFSSPDRHDPSQLDVEVIAVITGILLRYVGCAFSVTSINTLIIFPATEVRMQSIMEHTVRART